MYSLFIHSPDSDTPKPILLLCKLALTSQTKLTLTLTLYSKTKLTLERGTNPTKP